MLAPPSPVVVVPGLTASELQDEYELPPEVLWSAVRRKNYDRIALHPEDRRYELLEPARVSRRGPLPLIYEELIEELRDELAEHLSGPVPVFPFGYDWRMPLEWTEERLSAFVAEVIDRTSLLRHYRDVGYASSPMVTLIGHSMGGLLIAGYLERHGAGLIDRVVTIAAPFRGSHEAILAMATGTSDLADTSGKARERRMARMTPSLYYLLPSFEGAVTVDEGGEADIFSPEAWQPSIARALHRQVADWGTSGHDLFRLLLDEARAHRERIAALKLGEPEGGSASGSAGSGPSPAPLPRRRWLAIVGVDAETRTGLRVRLDADGSPRFDLRGAERRNEWDRDATAARRQTGDGTVALAGALPPFMDERHVVCVAPSDFGYWELRDRALSGLAGLHGTLPKMNMLHRMIVRFLMKKDDRYDNTWGRRVPGAAEWEPPLPLGEKGG